MRMIARKLGFYLLTAILAVTVDFFIPRLMPATRSRRSWPTCKARSRRAPSVPWRRSTG